MAKPKFTPKFTTKFTPGPWKRLPNAPWVVTAAERKSLGGDRSPSNIVKATNTSFSCEEDEANLDLIAAAPAMYAELERTAIELSRLVSACPSMACDIERIFAVLAQARGELS